jgi:sigma-B regulation protein RsbU (phosphoserine phosphatase)
MEEAAKIVETLLPDKPPEIPGYDIAGLSIPRHDGVGGDYLDYIPEPDGSWGLAIADVCGKGIQAALLMATLRAGLRLEVVKQQDLQAVAMALNSLIIESSPIDRYVTCFYARLQPDTGTLTSINAGHCFPMVIRSDGRVKRLKAGGLIVGMYPEDMLLEIEEYSVEITQLFSGDVVLLYTDGVTEATNIDGEEYGEARLETLVLQERQKNVNEICSAIYNAVIDFQGDAPQFDDLTLMVVKNKK